MFIIHNDLWEIVEFEKASTEEVLRDAPDRVALTEVLREFKPDCAVMLELRKLVAPPDPAFRLTDDEVIETLVWKLETRRLFVRGCPWRWLSGHSGGGGKDEPKPPQPGKKDQPPDKPDEVKSWFAITVKELVRGVERTVDGVMLDCRLPRLGETSCVTSNDTPVIRIDNLVPGGTADVLKTSHDEVWEVVTDV